ncbi:MAG: DUF4255 domain-containing protein [Gammaproteobacteria bacterium]
MSAGIISDISDSLRKLLQNQLKGLVSSDCVYVESPAEVVISQDSPTLIIFLYQITENHHFKNVDHERVASNQVGRPPFVVDLHYLFIPYGVDRSNEYQILGRVMQALADHPKLSGSDLIGELTGSNQEFHILYQSLGFEEIVRLWNTFYNRPFKTSVSYLVSSAGIDSAIAPETVQPVIQRELHIGMKE